MSYTIFGADCPECGHGTAKILCDYISEGRKALECYGCGHLWNDYQKPTTPLEAHVETDELMDSKHFDMDGLYNGPERPILDELEAELLPCPFCGDEAFIEPHDEGGGVDVACVSCGANIDRFGEDESPEIMTETWNRRALDALPATPLNELAAGIVEINRANGWNVTTPEDWPGDGEGELYKLGTVLALIHSEASEALEGLRHRDYENFREELADIVIRVLDCAGGLGIDMDEEVAKKLAKNRERGYRHGGKAV